MCDIEAHLLATSDGESEPPVQVMSYSRVHAISAMLQHLKLAGHIWEGDNSAWPYVEVEGVGRLSKIVFEVLNEKPVDAKLVDLHAQRGFYGPGEIYELLSAARENCLSSFDISCQSLRPLGPWITSI